jgi:hypothetical protein
VGGAGATGGPGEGGVEIGSLDEEEASELLLGLDVGSVEDLRFAVGDVDGGGGGNGLEALACLVGSGLLEGFGVGHVGGITLLLLFGCHAGPAFFV